MKSAVFGDFLGLFLFIPPMSCHHVSTVFKLVMNICLVSLSLRCSSGPSSIAELAIAHCEHAKVINPERILFSGASAISFKMSIKSAIIQ